MTTILSITLDAITTFAEFDEVDRIRGTDWRKIFSINTTAQ